MTLTGIGLLRREFRLIPSIIASVGAGDRVTAAAVTGHAQLMLGMLHEHHESEDQYIWPLLHQRVPDRDALVDTMEGQHEALAELIAAIEPGLPRWAATADTTLASMLSAHFRDLSGLLGDHLDQEEQTVLPLIREHLTVAEWKAPQAAAMKNGPTDFKSLMILAGVVLEDADPAERRWFLHEMPPPARVIWKLIGTRMYATRVRAVRALLGHTG